MNRPDDTKEKQLVRLICEKYNGSTMACWNDLMKRKKKSVKPDNSRSLIERCKGIISRLYADGHFPLSKAGELNQLLEQASLIALVQKHRLIVEWSHSNDRKWCIGVPLVEGGYDWKASAKTWTDAVRKAKRIIEKGKK